MSFSLQKSFFFLGITLGLHYINIRQIKYWWNFLQQ